jgi:hypothetical protein
LTFDEIPNVALDATAQVLVEFDLVKATGFNGGVKPAECKVSDKFLGQLPLREYLLARGQGPFACHFLSKGNKFGAMIRRRLLALLGT